MLLSFSFLDVLAISLRKYQNSCVDYIIIQIILFEMLYIFLFDYFFA